MAKAKTEKSKTPSFEEAQSNLLTLVEAMENGDIPLAELVDKYEKGMQLLAICRTHLNESELKIKKVQELNSSITKENL